MPASDRTITVAAEAAKRQDPGHAGPGDAASLGEDTNVAHALLLTVLTPVPPSGAGSVVVVG